jgi:ribonuclease R
MLVEDFMLLANREVATYMVRKESSGKENIPFVFRVHDEPDPDRVMELALFAKAMGLELDVSNPRAIAQSYNRIVKAAESEPGLKMLGPIAIRTMAKAIYTTENIGHYGLGFDNYTHFTSPIRRYADVLVHRILEKNLGGTYKVNPGELEEQCGHISRQERRAADAERESVKYKQVEFMEKHVGEEFAGRITGIADFGVFVALTENQCEGMISFDNMDESYELGSGKLSIEGRRSGKILRMGDPLLVKILDTDIKSRQISMGFVKALENVKVVDQPQPKAKRQNHKKQGTPKSDNRNQAKPRSAKPKSGSRKRNSRK